MSYKRLKSKRAKRHPGARGKTHMLDKLAFESRQTIAYMPVPMTPGPSPKRDLSRLQSWECCRKDSPKWVRCEGPEELGDFIEAESKRRNWFIDDVKRNGKLTKMRRRVAVPISDLIVTFAPWVSEYLNRELDENRDPRPQLRRAVIRWMGSVDSIFAGKRHWIATAAHMDSDDGHIDVILSRTDGMGGRIGPPGLSLSGPWTTGVHRQIKAGAEIAPEKMQRFKANMATHEARYGKGSVPLDIALVDAMDEAFAIEMPGVKPFMEAYARNVPNLERQHRTAALANARAKAEALESSLPQSHSPEPDDL